MDRHRILSEGVWVGLAGAAAVAVWFLVFDLIDGVPFRTPALLGAVLFHGLRDASELVITARLVGAYTIVHCAVFMLFLCFEVAAFAFVAVLGSWLLHTITPTAIIGANLIATVVMLSLLFRNHRRAPGEVLTSAE